MNVAAPNREIDLKGALSDEFGEWWSIWCDLLQASQILHDRTLIPDQPSNIFGRRGMWDGAVIAYCRCYKTGRRRALLKQMLDDLTQPQRASHDEAILWRDKHIAHRVDAKLERVSAVAVVDADNQVLEVQGKVTTSMSPSEVAIAEFAKLVVCLKDRVWETRLKPLEQALKEEFNSTNIQE
jgi:hypothetical protein